MKWTPGLLSNQRKIFFVEFFYEIILYALIIIICWLHSTVSKLFPSPSNPLEIPSTDSYVFEGNQISLEFLVLKLAWHSERKLTFLLLYILTNNHLLRIEFADQNMLLCWFHFVWKKEEDWCKNVKTEWIIRNVRKTKVVSTIFFNDSWFVERGCVQI